MSRLLATLLLSFVVWTSGAQALTFTDEEQQWLKDHPELLLGIDTTWPPFEFRNAQGTYTGLAAEYVNLITNQLGVSVKQVAASNWSEVLEQTKEGKLDWLPGVMSTPERQKRLDIFRRCAALVGEDDNREVQIGPGKRQALLALRGRHDAG